MARFRSPLLALICGLLLTGLGCANPADDKPEARVAEPVAPAATTPVGAEVFALSDKSTIQFTGSKVTGSHEGGFTTFDGRIELVDRDPAKSRVEVTIDTTSLWADDDQLTGHLKSPDFFDVEKFPLASFESTSIVESAEGYTVTGNLDLHGVIKSITFPAQIAVSADAVTARAEFFIKRFDFGILYAGKADNLIRDEVVIRLDLVAPVATGIES